MLSGISVFDFCPQSQFLRTDPCPLRQNDLRSTRQQRKGFLFSRRIWAIRGWAAHVLRCAPLPKGFRTGGWGAEDLSYRVQAGGSRGSCSWNTLPSMQTANNRNRCTLCVFIVFMQSSSETWGKTIRRRHHCRNCTKSMVEEPAVVEHFDPGSSWRKLYGLRACSSFHFVSSKACLAEICKIHHWKPRPSSAGNVALQRCSHWTKVAICNMHHASCWPCVCHTAVFTMWCAAKTGGELLWHFYGGEWEKHFWGSAWPPFQPEN